ncbi:hypothetical protein CVV38_02310 [Candidatus Peregrinibacteria bacterium HGW-Peregrinibacteria-1]|jgi:modulator of FtsH protease|nr:MAG: hypothetical protein CVV38_02310 [Candidatus Peregrinibacteria bacterium HGW-Peregrinibacteria-1]
MQNTTTLKSQAMASGFASKVIFFFALAILASGLGAWVSLNYFMAFLAATPAVIYGLFAVELILVFTSRIWSQKEGINKLLFFLFAFLTGVTLSPLLAVVLSNPAGAGMLTKALLISGMTFTGTAIWGATTKADLSGFRLFLMPTLIGMIIISVLGIFIPWGSTFELVFSGAGIILFSLFTAFDFQNLKNYPANAYIDAALHLFLDIFNLFTFVLRFLTAQND